MNSLEGNGPTFRRIESLSTANVRARFEIYPADMPDYEDIAAELIDPDDAVLEGGTNDGHFLVRLAVDKSHRGNLVGVDIDDSGFYKYTKQELTAGLGSLGIDQTLLEPPIRPKLLKVNMANLKEHFEPNSFDKICTFYSLYHAAPQELEKIFEGFRYLLKENGEVFLSTSGIENKKQIRGQEGNISNALPDETLPPLEMNAGLTTQKVPGILRVLMPEFDVYYHDEVIFFTIENENDLQKLLNNHRANRLEYDPIPDEDVFEEILERVVAKPIRKGFEIGEPFTDFASRSFFIITKNPKRAGLIDKGYKKIVR